MGFSLKSYIVEDSDLKLRMLNEALLSLILYREILCENSGFFRYPLPYNTMLTLKNSSQQLIDKQDPYNDDPNYNSRFPRNMYRKAKECLEGMSKIKEKFFKNIHNGTKNHIVYFLKSLEPRTKESSYGKYFYNKSDLFDIDNGIYTKDEVYRLIEIYNKFLDGYCYSLKHMFDLPNIQTFSRITSTKNLFNIQDSFFEKFTCYEIISDKKKASRLKQLSNASNVYAFWFSHDKHLEGISSEGKLTHIIPYDLFDSKKIRENVSEVSMEDLCDTYEIILMYNNTEIDTVEMKVPKELSSYYSANIGFRYLDYVRKLSYSTDEKSYSLGDVTKPSSNLWKRTTWGISVDDYVWVYKKDTFLELTLYNDKQRKDDYILSMSYLKYKWYRNILQEILPYTLDGVYRIWNVDKNGVINAKTVNVENGGYKLLKDFYMTIYKQANLQRYKDIKANSKFAKVENDIKDKVKTSSRLTVLLLGITNQLLQNIFRISKNVDNEESYDSYSRVNRNSLTTIVNKVNIIAMNTSYINLAYNELKDRQTSNSLDDESYEKYTSKVNDAYQEIINNYQDVYDVISKTLKELKKFENN